MAGITLMRMAVRELWISFRLLLLLAMPLTAGLLSLLLSADPALTQPALAWGIAVAATFAAGIAATGWAAERRRGTAGWLSLHAVPRGSILIAWFAGLAFPLIVGLAAGVLLAWLGAGAAPGPPLDALAYATIVAGGVAGALQALAIGMVFGSVMRPVGAGVLAMLTSGGMLAAGLLIAPEPPLLPSAGLGLIAAATDLARPMSDGLQAVGLGLTMTGLVLGVALLVFDRVDL